MADVCWWFFFSKIIELLDTVSVLILEPLTSSLKIFVILLRLWGKSGMGAESYLIHELHLFLLGRFPSQINILFSV